MRASPGAGFTSRRLGKTKRRLVRAISLPKPKKSMLPFHTRAFIRIPSPGKSTHVFTRKMFLPDYHRIQCEGLRFQVFTRAAEWLWRVENTSFTQKKPLNSGENQHLRPDCCEHLKTQAFTLETPDNQEGRAIMWKGECFFEGKNGYRKHGVEGYKLGFSGALWRLGPIRPNSLNECEKTYYRWNDTELSAV